MFKLIGSLLKESEETAQFTIKSDLFTKDDPLQRGYAKVGTFSGGNVYVHKSRAKSGELITAKFLFDHFDESDNSKTQAREVVRVIANDMKKEALRKKSWTSISIGFVIPHGNRMAYNYQSMKDVYDQLKKVKFFSGPEWSLVSGATMYAPKTRIKLSHLPGRTE